ncbi:XVIPCD domain-containing protein [Stenotrophomonas sp.]|uniref:XVIPCD domain-containing protein n=1 Tax=Stenotrophomonas sp. TaxID=69392 RepID=UPI0028AAA37B|nr:XVIPCD domain-containing protein [Stenotrophomonas sp.]
MTNFVFDDFARTTLARATNISDGSPLSPQQIDSVVHYLKSAGSGPDSASSYAEFVSAKMQALPPRLPAGVDYVAFSGVDSLNVSNYQNAVNYGRDLGGKAGIIGDTPWGVYITDVESHPARHPDFMAAGEKLQRYMDASGVEPLFGDHAAALRDMMWNAGSPKFFENAISTGNPLLALVENAPANRGFSNFELTTALEHPDVRINGYPVSAFGPEPLAFVSKSAAEYQALERSLAEAASLNSGQPVTVAEVRLQLKPIDGYDAVDQVLFDRPLHEFKSFNLSEMAATRAEWHVARGSLATGPRLHADAAEPVPHAPSQPGAPRGPPSGAATLAEVAAESAPRAAHPGLSPGMKVAGIAGVALMAHEFGTTGHKWVELYSQGNAAGADSTAAHFVGANVGGALGGFVAGAGVGLTTGSWTGPGAIVAGIGGGVLGAHLGDRWAEQRDIDRIFKQEDPMGRVWTRDPANPDRRWLRASDQQQVQSGDLGSGVEVRPVQTALGEDVTVRTHYVATGTLERQLDWKAAKASYELGLTNPPPAQDPYRLRARDDQGPAPGPFETGRAFVRDPASRQWELEIKQMVDGHVPITRTAPVSAEQSLQLDEQSRAVIAQNAANTPAAMAARYMVAYEQGRWSDFGDSENPSIPLAIQNARDGADTLRASDGNRYTRDPAGQWASEGLVFHSAANRNVSEELEVTWQSQKAGVAGLNDMAEEIKANVQLAPEGIRGQVDALYKQHGIERTEQQLAATAAAVEQNLASSGRQGDLVLELMPDPRTHAPSAESAIAAFGDAGGRMVLTATTTMEDVAKIQSLHQQPAVTAAARDEAHITTLDAVTVNAPSQPPRPEQMPAQEPHAPNAVPSAVAPVQQAAPVREVPAVEAVPWTPTNPNHPDHGLYQEIRKEVTALDAAHGRTYDQTSERLTGSLLVLAKGNGMDHVDHVVLSRPTANQPGGQNVFVVQGELNDPGHLRAGMPTQQAVTAPFEQSMAQFDVVAKEQEQAQQLTRQREMGDQQEVQRSAMRMG